MTSWFFLSDVISVIEVTQKSLKMKLHAIVIAILVGIINTTDGKSKYFNSIVTTLLKCKQLLCRSFVNLVRFI